MQMLPVTSSTVAAIGYDPAAKQMAVQFKSGGTYVYHSVPQEEYEALMASQSKGQYVHKNIKGKYNPVKRSI